MSYHKQLYFKFSAYVKLNLSKIQHFGKIYMKFRQECGLKLRFYEAKREIYFNPKILEMQILNLSLTKIIIVG